MSGSRHVARAPAGPAAPARAPAAPSPAQAVLALQRGAGNRATGRVLARTPDPARGRVGTRLGTNGAGAEVKVTSEAGDPNGYADEWQARAVARMAGLEPAAVVQTDDKRWHAVGTDGDFQSVKTESRHGFAAVHGLPSAKGSGGTNEERGSRTLGVPKGDIQANLRATDRVAGKVNLNPQYNKTDYLGKHGRASHQDEGFDVEVETAIELAQKLVDDPALGPQTLFHESSHRIDWELARTWVRAFNAKSGHGFVSGNPTATKNLRDWMLKQVGKGVTAGEAELVVDIATGSGGSTEARAYIRTFIAQFEAGQAAEATRALANYAGRVAKGKEAEPPARHPLLKELTAELAAARRRLPKDRQAAFDAALKGAREAGPKTWLGTVKVP